MATQAVEVGAKSRPVRCLGCGDIIPQVDGSGRPRRYCSGECWRIRKRELRLHYAVENHEAEQARQRGKSARKGMELPGTCLLCNDKPHIHHIDGDPENNDPSNLLLLCNTHHQGLHRQQRAIRTARSRAADVSAK